MKPSAGRSALAQSFVGVLIVGMFAMMMINFRYQVITRTLDVRRQAVMSAEGSAQDAADIALCNELYSACEEFLAGPGRLLALTGRDCGARCGE